MTVEELKKKKISLGLTNERISELADVPISTVQKVFAGVTTRPREDTLKRIERALIKEEIDRKAMQYKYRPDDSSWVGETNLLDLYDDFFADLDYPFEPIPDDVKAPDKKQGEYTLLDYYAMPPDRRIELIDGCIYDMAVPTDVHQLIIGTLYNKIYMHLMENDSLCTACISPIDVRLDRDDRTMLQPDIIVVCGEHRSDDTDGQEDQQDNKQAVFEWEDILDDEYIGYKEYGDYKYHEDYEDYDRPLTERAHRYFDGAPDLVIEVMSPSSKERDMRVKLRKYMNAGVREYWIVDPEREKVIVSMQDRSVICIYTFNDTVPVTISGGSMSIDFRAVKRMVHRQLDNLR